MYIHRVGRTARYNAVGRALMMTLPHEENTLIPMLQNNGVPIKKLTVNPKKTMSVGSQAAALLVAQPECRALAKKAFVGYLRSIQLIPSNRDLDVNTLPLDDFATSLGLAFTPIVPVVQKGEEGREQVRQSKNVNRSLDKLKKQIKEVITILTGLLTITYSLIHLLTHPLTHSLTLTHSLRQN
jgi:ATP-dependent RNA helicase DDX10/DBP4